MHRLVAYFGVVPLFTGCLTQPALAQKIFTWQQIRDQFEAANPTLRAGLLNIQESKAQEITANLRPNPNLNFGLDQLDPFDTSPFRPFAYTFPSASVDYLHERAHKRELRLESAQKGTGLAESAAIGPGTHPAVQSAHGFRANPAGQARAGHGQGKPGLLRQGTGDQSRPLTSRRHRPRGPGPAGAAARPIPVRLRNRHGEFAHRQDHPAGAAERPHAGGPVRRHRAVRFRRQPDGRSKSFTPLPLATRPDLQAAAAGGG